MQHVFMGPPDMDPAAAETLREGLAKAFYSEAYKAEALQVLSYVPSRVDHNRQYEILGATADVAPEVLEFIEGTISKNGNN